MVSSTPNRLMLERLAHSLQDVPMQCNSKRIGESECLRHASNLGAFRRWLTCLVVADAHERGCVDRYPLFVRSHTCDSRKRIISGLPQIVSRILELTIIIQDRSMS